MKGLLIRVAGKTKLLQLGKGKHKYKPGACAMEAAALLAGEKKTENPHCVDASLCSLFIATNDSWNTEDRQKLWKYVLRALNTNDPAYRDSKYWLLIKWCEENKVTTIAGGRTLCWRPLIMRVKEANRHNVSAIMSLLEVLLPDSRDPDIEKLDWDRALEVLEYEEIKDEDDFIITHA